jgi:hypothetical protein
MLPSSGLAPLTLVLLFLALWQLVGIGMCIAYTACSSPNQHQISGNLPVYFVFTNKDSFAGSPKQTFASLTSSSTVLSAS